METALAGEVLGKYLELFQHNSYDFKYHFAPNGVIDWYGCPTITGALKIHDYLRYEINANFQHCKFTDARICAPIETKTTHMRTKIMTNKCMNKVHPLNHLINLSDVLVSKTNMLRNQDKSCIEDLTPPASASKEDNEHATEYLSNQGSQKLKSRASTTSKHAALHSGIHSSDSARSDDDDDLESLKALYSPLQYIEVRGVMRLRSSKISKSSDNHMLEKDSLERETHLKLSYRRCLEDNQLQFVLVIYEDVDASLPLPKPKCNLLMQLSLALVKSDIENDATTTNSMNVREGLTQDADALVIARSVEQMQKPTKRTQTPSATPKRKSRYQMRPTDGRKRLNNSPSAPVPKRSTARYLRL